MFTQANLGKLMAAKQSISLKEAWMNVHKNARLTPYRRAELVARVQDGEPGRDLALAFGVSVRTVRKWWARFATATSA